MKLRANLIQQHLKKDRTNKGFSLDIHMQQISTIYNLPDFLSPSELFNLDLSFNYLRDLDPVISRFSNLQWLDLTANSISTSGDLTSLRSLEYLNISTNNLYYLNTKDLPPNLKLLDLSMNRLTSVDFSVQSSIESLILAGNQLDSLPSLSQMPNLKELDICKNLFTDLEFLKLDPPNILILKASYNRLDDCDLVLDAINFVATLEELELIGNEVTVSAKYESIPLLLPNLKVLDGVTITEKRREHLKEKELEKEFENVGLEVQEQYLKRIRDEFENRKHYKQLLEDRKGFIGQVFEEYEAEIERDLTDFNGFVKKNKEEKAEIKGEVLGKWRKELSEAEKERERLTRIAIKHQEEIKRDLLNSKLKSTKLTQKLYEISMTQPVVWQELKQKELSQIRQEEQEQFLRDREIPKEESSEHEDDLIDQLETEFKHDVANLLSDKIREVQTKDLQKERKEAVNMIKSTLKQRKTLSMSPIEQSRKSRPINPETMMQKTIIHLDSKKPNGTENVQSSIGNKGIEEIWGVFGQEEESIGESEGQQQNFDLVPKEKKKEESHRNEPKHFDLAPKERKKEIVQREEPKEITETGVVLKNGKDVVDYKSKREEFLEKKRRFGFEPKEQKEKTEKTNKSKKCFIF